MSKLSKELDKASLEALEKVQAAEDGSDEKKTAMHDMQDLHRMKMEETKSKQEMISKILDAAAKVGVCALTIVAYSSFLSREQFFEINNSPRTRTFQNLLGNMLPKLK